jgi:hypothetical protein
MKKIFVLAATLLAVTGCKSVQLRRADAPVEAPEEAPVVVATSLPQALKDTSGQVTVLVTSKLAWSGTPGKYVFNEKAGNAGVNFFINYTANGRNGCKSVDEATYAQAVAWQKITLSPSMPDCVDFDRVK